MATRFKVHAEVCVSKIAPAGAGWWAANAFAADTLGFAGTDFGYFVVTGMGDALAVMGGHSIYFACKSVVVPSAGIEMSKEFQMGQQLKCRRMPGHDVQLSRSWPNRRA